MTTSNAASRARSNTPGACSTSTPGASAGGTSIKPILALDPGTEQSAWVLYTNRPVDWGITSNTALVAQLRSLSWFPMDPSDQHCIIEQLESYVMAVGREVYITAHWAVGYHEAWLARGTTARVSLVPRRAVKLAICGSPRANDANIRHALIDLWGGRAAALGSKLSPGPLYGIKADVWAALALAVTARLGGADVLAHATLTDPEAFSPGRV